MTQLFVSLGRLGERIGAAKIITASAMAGSIKGQCITFSVAILPAAVAGLLLLTAGAQAQSAGEWRDAEHLYNSSCTFCHDTGVGPTLKGVGWPEEYVEIRVRQGYRAMPAFKPSEISASDIEALAKWLAEQKPVAGDVEARQGS